MSFLDIDRKEGEGGKPRRRGENFIHLSRMFEEGSTRDDRGEAVTGAEQGCDNIQKYKPSLFQNSNNEGQIGEKGKPGTLLGTETFQYYPGSNTNFCMSRVLRCDMEKRRGAFSLVSTPTKLTNRKRARDHDAEFSDLINTPVKKVKV